MTNVRTQRADKMAGFVRAYTQVRRYGRSWAASRIAQLYEERAKLTDEIKRERSRARRLMQTIQDHLERERAEQPKGTT